MSLHSPLLPATRAPETPTKQHKMISRFNPYAVVVGSGDGAEIRPAEIEVNIRLLQPLAPTFVPPVSELVLPFSRVVVVLRYDDSELLQLILNRVRCICNFMFVCIWLFCLLISLFIN